ncbi:MAG: DNA-binding beta-propeller fold protein YncE/mono/diheme cytochrome c family protein [Myxococcota bacterium]|jgi:DNA-binding beta-propeller fold protein YncE/mono/diheme cytochrome c family protein
MADGRLWVASPDDDAVVLLDPDSLEEVGRFAVPGQPEQLIVAAGKAVVSALRSRQVTVIHDGSATSIPVPCGGTRGLVALGERVWVTCPFDDRVVELDVAELSVVRSIDAPGRPTAIAVVGGRLVVSASRLGRLHSAPVDGPFVWQEHSIPVAASRSAVQVDALTVVAGQLAGVYLEIDHDGDRTRPASEGGYGTVLDGKPRIEGRLLAACGGRYSRFDAGIRVMSGPRALAWSESAEWLWVVNMWTQNVAVLRCPRPDGAPIQSALTGAARSDLVALVAAFRVGDGPRGIVLSDDGRTAWVDVGFDHAVARLQLPETPLDTEPSQALEPTLTRTRATSPLRLSSAGEQGRRLFHDAVNTHLTPSGVVTCATCHPDGGEDGVSWFLHTEGIPGKFRRTPAAWNARPELLPLHWDGEFSDAASLVKTTILDLMEGDALVVDTAAVGIYMSELSPPVSAPTQDAEAVARGGGLFASDDVGCAGCHSGSAGSDGLLHDVVATSLDPDGHLPAVLTPGLQGVRARAPYLHDGRAATLKALLIEHNADGQHGKTGSLSDAQQADLISYLRSL